MKNHQTKNNHFRSKNSTPGPVFYIIKIQDQLDPQRSKWFEGMTLTYIEQDEAGFACTLISGPLIDQPALHGLLTKIRDLNLTLISVQRFVREANTFEQAPIRSDPSADREDSA